MVPPTRLGISRFLWHLSLRSLKEPSLRTWPGAHGEFSFDGFMGSMVTISAVAGAVRAEAMACAAPGKTTHVELTFQRDARIAGKVLEPKGRYRVHAWHVRGPGIGIGRHPIETESLSDGSFELAVTPGTWQVSAAPSHASSTYLQAKP